MTVDEVKYAALRRKKVKCYGTTDGARIAGLFWKVPIKGPARTLVVIEDSNGRTTYQVPPARVELAEEDAVPATAAEYALEVAAKAELGINSSRDKSDFAVDCKETKK